MLQADLQMTPSETYKQNRYRSIDQSWVNQHEKHLVEHLLSLYNLSGATVLDAPCGYGRFFPLYKHFGMPTTGVDLNLDMTQLARQMSPWLNRQQILHGDVLNLPFASETFDIVICIRLLHHTFHESERRQLFMELARVSHRYVLISYYHFDWLHAWSCLWRWRRKGRVPAILNEDTFNELTRVNNLEILSTHSLLRYGHMQTFSMLEKAETMKIIQT